MIPLQAIAAYLGRGGSQQQRRQRPGERQQAQRAQQATEELGPVAAAIFEHVDLRAVARACYGPTGVAQVRCCGRRCCPVGSRHA